MISSTPTGAKSRVSSPASSLAISPASSIRWFSRSHSSSIMVKSSRECTDSEPHRNKILALFSVQVDFIVQKGHFHLFFFQMRGAESGAIKLVFLRQK